MIISFSKPTRYVAGWLGILSCLVMPLSVSAGLMSSFQAGDGDWHLGTLTVGNVDASPDLEIIVPYRNSSGQWMLDAFKWNGTRLPGFPYASSQNAVMNTSPTLADLNGDGINEII
ncbi:MAG: Fibronectin type domain protein, partial [Pedosphaera sp.]|nr:Fibronectin type domain protein [Pedosphaera sp.]